MRSKSHLNPKPNVMETSVSSLRRIMAATLLAVVAFAAALIPVGISVADAQSSPVIVETFAVQIHGNGSQMKVKQVEIHDDHTLVVFEVINGRDFATHFNATTRDTRIEDDRGRSYPLLRGFQSLVEPGRGSTISLGFAPIPTNTESISFFFRDRGAGDDTNDEREGFPSYQFDDIDLTQDIDEPALPADLAPEETTTHPNGTNFTVLAVEFERGSIRVEFEARNPTDRRVDLSNGRHSSFIEDDRGNRYYLKLNDGEAFLRLPQNRRFEGTLRFAGRIHPDATSINLLMNHDESETNNRSLAPKFELGPWTIADAAPGDDSALAIDETQTHPNGSTLSLERLEFKSNGTLLDFDFSNGDGLVFLNGCCRHTYLLDDLGNRYLLQRPDGNSSLRVQRNRGLSGTLAFVGELDANATEISVVFNDRDEDGSDEDTLYPEFRFGPYEVERSDEGSTGDDGGDGGDSDGSLEDILDDFDARAGRRTVSLTIPADDLFEEGESDLEEGRTFEQLLQVLELYEDEEILIVAHTDSQGSSSTNQRLSERQADALAEALGDAGIDIDLIEAEGEGEAKPVVDDDSASSREVNRRIKITIFTSDGLPG